MFKIIVTDAEKNALPLYVHNGFDILLEKDIQYHLPLYHTIVVCTDGSCIFVSAECAEKELREGDAAYAAKLHSFRIIRTTPGCRLKMINFSCARAFSLAEYFSMNNGCVICGIGKEAMLLLDDIFELFTRCDERRNTYIAFAVYKLFMLLGRHYCLTLSRGENRNAAIHYNAIRKNI